jgi:hypothetical protein
VKKLVYSLLLLVLAASLFLSGCGNDVTNGPGETGVTNGPEEKGLWVTSFPEGAEVYVASGTRSDYENMEIIQDIYFQGSTPMILDIEPGGYLIAVVISADKLEDMGYSVESPPDSTGYGPDLSDLFESDGNFVSVCSYDVTQPGRLSYFEKVYELQKTEDNDSVVSILIPIDEEKYPQSPPYLYPSLDMVSSIESSYLIHESDMVEGITENLTWQGLEDTVGAAMITEMAEVVSRVGKVVLFCTDGIEITLQIIEPETGGFMIQVRS